MRFSVLIPVYNVEKYIDDCISSVLSQDFLDYEVILVDDGSTDKSGEICDLYARSHRNIKVIHQENKGLLCTRRAAIKMAKGDYFIFVDSDDFIEQNMFFIVNTLIESKHPDMIIINGVRYYNGKTYMHKQPMYQEDRMFLSEEKKELYYRLLKREMSNTLWTKVVKRSIVDIGVDYRNFTGLNMGEDLMQSLPMLTNAKTIIYLNKVLYYYRVNQYSITKKYNNNSFTSLVDVNKILDRYVSAWEIENGNVLAADRFMVDIYDMIAPLLKTGNKKLLIEEMKKVSSSEYFRSKYQTSNLNRLNIRQRITVVSLHSNCVIGLGLIGAALRIADKIRSLKWK